MVQGVGFRPFVWQLATKMDLVGWVLNDSAGVTIEVQGEETAIADFVNRLRSESPPLAKIDSVESLPMAIQVESEFRIRESIEVEQGTTPIAPDVSMCDDCKQELFDETDRRFQYPFINCTNCGPRFTIVEAIPYDRPKTTMKSFPMCELCQAEYDDPSNRRFHAQPNACEKCGPAIWLLNSGAPIDEFASRTNEADTGCVLDSFQSLMKQGKIVAVKGIGGFHLVCDATNEEAVVELRKRKGRIDKPFAVMVRDADQAEPFASVSIREKQLLECRERPIVLLTKIARPVGLAESVAPENDFVGVMLPYSPLHSLLVQDVPLLMTSGNRADEPIARTNEEAKERLGRLADFFLLHDREIHVVCDDSVVRNVDNDLLPIRRSRGYAPMPIRLDDEGPSVLAVGGEIKSTFCVVKGNYAWMSQHIGDMGNAETLAAMQRNVEHFVRLFQVDPKAICADLHPGYLSGQWAEQMAKRMNVPLYRVQHHFAHVASLIAEHNLPHRQKIIGCCFDGTGYGTDQTIWGGEVLIADTVTFERFASLDPFPLPGGDSSVKRPGRIALSLLWSHQIDWSDELAPVRAMRANEMKLLRQQLERNLNCVQTSSMGRLFDAVAALIGIRQEINYEAQAAMEMEAMAASAIEHVNADYSFELFKRSLWRMNAANLLRAVCDDLSMGTLRQEVAAKFHHAVADAILKACELARDETGEQTVGLTGGVFQNVLLLRLAVQKLRQSGFQVLTHSVVPPNDGGIALGQAVVARNWLKGKN